MSTKQIYHMLPQAEWDAQYAGQEGAQYRAASLQDEGFIHCTGELELLVIVANHFYRPIEGPFVVLEINEEQIEAAVRWEAADSHLFPHIYGPLNLNAVTRVFPFPRSSQGEFLSLAHEQQP